MRRYFMNTVLSVGLGLAVHPLLAFEHTKVLPKGVRNLTLKNVRTTIAHKSSQSGRQEPLAKPLEKELSMGRVLKGEKGLKKAQLEGLMLAEGFGYDEALGQFSADMKGRVAVTAPIFSIGLSENFTLALAVPYYQAHMAVATGFTIKRSTADRLVHSLVEKNDIKAANEVIDKLNDAVGQLNKKLRDHGYRSMTDWQGSGIGDVTLVGKYKAFDHAIVKLATASGLVAPSGRVDNPDILNDVPFGKGHWDAFGSVMADEYIRSDFFFNQYAKYTYHFPGKRSLRLITSDETIEVEKAKARFTTGQQWETGLSLQYEPEFGLLAGVGYVVGKKFGDKYSIQGHQETVAELQKNSHQQSQHWEAKLGYSGVPAYKRGTLPLPFLASLEYKRHVASVNSFTNDFVSFDLAFFF